MNLSQVETFLSIVRLGSLSKAANHLYVSQSTISQRLNNIEKEYSVILLEREKGVKSVSLTNEGERFYQIALKYESLLLEAKNLKSMSTEATITIGAVDSVHNYILNTIYPLISQQNSHIRIAIHTHQSNEIYSLIDRREIDIGFSLQDRILRNVKVSLLFEEQMVMIRSKKNDFINRIIPNNELIPENQLYINWGIDYHIWHEKHWGPPTNTYIQIDTAKMLLEFLSKGEYWAVVPVSIARNFHKQGWIDVCLLEDPPPFRNCYQVEREGLNIHAQQVSEFIFQSKTRIEQIVRPWENQIGY